MSKISIIKAINCFSEIGIKVFKHKFSTLKNLELFLRILSLILEN